MLFYFILQFYENNDKIVKFHYEMQFVAEPVQKRNALFNKQGIIEKKTKKTKLDS